MFETMKFDWKLAEGTPSAESVAMLCGLDPTTLDHGDSISANIGVERAKRMLDAFGIRFQAQAVATAPTHPTAPGPGLQPTAEELSCALGLHPHTAVHQVDQACGIVRRLPVTLKRLEAGEITRRHAETVETATTELSDEDAAAVEADAVPGHPLRLKSRLARAIARIAPDHARKKADKQRADRGVTYWSDPVESIAGLEVQGPLDKIAQIKAGLDAEARTRIAGECRPIAARRFDVLLDWARQALGLDDPTSAPSDSTSAARQESAAPTEPTPAGAAATAPAGRRACGSCGRSGPTKIPINVTVPLTTLLRLSEAPGDLNGNPIPAEAARHLAADGSWRRWLLEPTTGHLLDVGATTYRPSAALDRYVRGRDRTCRFPTCTRPAVDCDLDHTIAFHTEDGQTIRLNLADLCRHHHRLKHETAWNYRMDPDTTCHWTAPSGRIYTQPPEDHDDDPVLSADFARYHARQRQRAERAAAKLRPPAPRPPDPDENPPF